MIDDRALDALIDAAAPILGLKLDVAWRDAVRTHLGLSLRHGLAVAEFALPDEIDPAPVYRA